MTTKQAEAQLVEWADQITVLGRLGARGAQYDGLRAAYRALHSLWRAASREGRARL